MKFSTLLALTGGLAYHAYAFSQMPMQNAGGHKVSLLPTHGPGHKAEDLVHLTPNLLHTMHFRESGKAATDPSPWGRLTSTFVHPAVLLDHSSHLSRVACSNKGIDICFKNKEAEEHVRQGWSSSPMILSTHHPGCGDYDSGARTYWYVSSVESKEGQPCIAANATEVPLQEAMREFDLEFGHYDTPVAPVKEQTTSRQQKRSALIASGKDVDISNDPQALSAWFGTKVTSTYPDSPEATPELYNGTVEMKRRSPYVLQRRGLGWLEDIGAKAINFIRESGEYVAQKVKETVETAGKAIGRLVHDFINYEWSLGTSVSRDFNIPSADSRKVQQRPNMFGGKGEGLEIAGHGVLPGNIICDNCYAKGEISFGGHIGWTVKEGLKSGYLTAAGFWDSRLVLGLQLQGQAKVEAKKKELLAKNLLNLEIPKMISVGPEITLTAVFDIYFNAHADILIGGKLQIEKGEAVLDLLDTSKNQFNGFSPKLTPIAEYSGAEASVTLDFGLPLGLEFGVDLLGGTWKKTVGVIDQPSFQVRAKSLTESCVDGLDVNLAVRNYLFLAAMEVYDYAIDQRDIWSQPLGCIPITLPLAPGVSPKAPVVPPANLTSGGSSRSRNLTSGGHSRRQSADNLYVRRQPSSENPREAVNKAFPSGAISSKPPTLYPVKTNITDVDPLTGLAFTLLSDVNRTTVLISGKEERLYLAPYGNPETSAGSPFAYVDGLREKVIMGDVYGGYLNFNPTEMQATGVSNLRSSRLTSVPVGSKFLSLVPTVAHTIKQPVYVATDDKSVYGLAACSVVNMGTRVYVVDMDRDPIRRMINGTLQDTVIGGPVRGCQYLLLTSNTPGVKL